MLSAPPAQVYPVEIVSDSASIETHLIVGSILEYIIDTVIQNSYNCQNYTCNSEVIERLTKLESKMDIVASTCSTILEKLAEKDITKNSEMEKEILQTLFSCSSPNTSTSGQMGKSPGIEELNDFDFKNPWLAVVT